MSFQATRKSSKLQKEPRYVKILLIIDLDLEFPDSIVLTGGFEKRTFASKAYGNTKQTVFAPQAAVDLILKFVLSGFQQHHKLRDEYLKEISPMELPGTFEGLNKSMKTCEKKFFERDIHK